MYKLNDKVTPESVKAIAQKLLKSLGLVDHELMDRIYAAKHFPDIVECYVETDPNEAIDEIMLLCRLVGTVKRATAKELLEDDRLNWEERIGEAIKHIYQAAQKLKHPAFGTDQWGLARHLDHPPYGTNNNLKKPAEPRSDDELERVRWEFEEDVRLPIDMGTPDGIKWLGTSDILPAALERIVKAMLTVYEENPSALLPLYARGRLGSVYKRWTERIDLIGKRGKAAANPNSQTRGLLVKVLSERIPAQLPERYAAIAELATIAGYPTKRQQARSILEPRTYRKD